MARKLVYGALRAGHDLGGGDRHPIRLVTDGQIVFEIAEGVPVAHMPSVDTDPESIRKGTGGFFFRMSGTQMQFCVRFPSGVVQVLSTEPA